MRKLLITTCIISFQMASAQVDSLKQHKEVKEFIASIITNNGELKKGLITSIQDSGITIRNIAGSKYRINTGEENPSYTYRTIDPQTINFLEVKRNHSVKRGARIGAGIGFVLGAILGFASGNDPVPENSGSSPAFNNPRDERFWNDMPFSGGGGAGPLKAEDKAFIDGACGGIIGALVGAITGVMIKKTFIIKGKSEKYQAMKMSVLERTYRK